jgi:hypothetical protein
MSSFILCLLATHEIVHLTLLVDLNFAICISTSHKALPGNCLPNNALAGRKAPRPILSEDLNIATALVILTNFR